MRIFLLVLLLNFPAYAQQWWSVQTSGLDTNLRGVSVSYDQGSEGKQHYIIWASGSNGVILRSTNDGKTWEQLSVPGGGDLDFRDIEAFDAERAYVMSSGEGDKSRIYKTGDGGKTWRLEYSDKRTGFFLDALACESATRCYALSDPVDGKFLVLATEDGEHWKELPRDKMPAALPNEGAFAASGTALALCEDGSIYFGTGVGAARIFRSTDQGRSWKVATTPVPSGPTGGIFSVACYGRSDALVAVGGDYKAPAEAKRVAIYSQDGGETWSLSEEQPGGYRSAVGSFSYGDFAAVGPNGTDISHDRGKHWKHSDHLNLNAVSFEGTAGWAVGAKGTIARFKDHYEYLIKNGGATAAGSAAKRP
ncbi:MAG TPA: YCF48-related protein [Terriglobales bacterium]|nr:YCF48-related protein [Terriglobales bacterium]